MARKTSIWGWNVPTNSANSSAPKTICWLVVEPTHLKNISQIGSFPQVKVNKKNVWNHHLLWKWWMEHFNISRWCWVLTEKFTHFWSQRNAYAYTSGRRTKKNLYTKFSRHPTKTTSSKHFTTTLACITHRIHLWYIIYLHFGSFLW